MIARHRRWWRSDLAIGIVYAGGSAVAIVLLLLVIILSVQAFGASR